MDYSSDSSFSITTEQFKLFHTIDRELYSRLVLQLGHDPTESMQIMAFWLWLERAGYESCFVKKLLSLPLSLLNELVKETFICLRCIEGDVFDFDWTCINTLQNLIRKEINLWSLHENRVDILGRVTKIMNEVCARAFKDIMRHVFDNIQNAILMASNQGVASGIHGSFMPGFDAVYNGGGKAMAGSSLYHPSINLPFYPSVAAVPPMGHCGGSVKAGQVFPHGEVPSHFGQVFTHGAGPYNFGQVFSDGAGPSNSGQNFPHGEGPSHLVAGGNLKVSDPLFDLSAQRRILNEEITEMLSRVNLMVTNEEEKEEEVAPDDRTIFLTFSKGYPISETEVAEFFTRKFGQFIESIYMQEVTADEQVLYARLICYSPTIIETIVGRRGKAKYSINGKHVWARKYVKHHPKSPLVTATPSSRLTLPLLATPATP